MAFAFTGTSGTNNATITQTGQYATITVTTAISFTGANWSFVGTLGGTVQAGATTLDAVGRAIYNSTRATGIASPRQSGSGWISSISSITGGATNVTVTGPRYFLADGTEDVLIAEQTDVFFICQNERDLIAAATTDTNFLVDTSPSYAGIAGVRTDIPWGQGRPNLIRLGTNAQACRFVIGATGFFCISDNTHILWAQGGNTQVTVPAGGTLQVAGVFIMGRHFTLPVGNSFSTALLYPGVSLTSDTLATTHVANMNVAVQSAAYAYFGGTIGGPVFGITTFGQAASTRLHFRKCNVWSVGNTVNTNTNPTIFCGATSGVFTCDELTLTGTHVLQREGSIMNIYSLINKGAGFIQAENTDAVTFNGYQNVGSQNGFDFGGFRCFATSAGGTGASIILSYNSTAGTNIYAGSADLTFVAGNNQNINIEFHRNLTLRATNAAGTTLTTPVAYLKDVTRTVTTTAANPRGAVSAAPDGTQATCGQTVTSRSGTTVLFDAIQVQYDRTYTAVSNTAAIDILLGEVYTNSSTVAATTSRVGRPGYEGNSGLATNRISRRGKDDNIGLRTNRDNYDVYWWDYNTLFGRTSDFSLNANSTQVQILLNDGDITQQTPATVGAYTSLETAAKIYDYFKYYKTAAGTVDGRVRLARLELGGIDGSAPTTLALGGGGYLCYANGSTLQFNPIFSAATISTGSNAAPLQIAAAAQGPISGSWNGTVYTYGNAARATSTATVQGALTLFAGTSTISSTSTFNALAFGTINLALTAQAIGTGNWASISANQITLGTGGGNGTTIFQNLAATTAIVGLPTTGSIGSNAVIGFGTGSAAVLTGDISFTLCTLTGLLTLNVGATGRTLTLTNCGDLTVFPFARSALSTGIISVLPIGNTVLGTLPTGFVATVQTTITLTFADSPTIAPTIRVSELSKNSGTGVTLTNPVFANGAYTWIITSLASDTIDGAIFMVDGYTVTRGISSINTSVNATANPEANIDFGQTLSAADTAFIATTAWNVTNAFAATNAYVQMLTTQATTYQTTSATRSAVELAKLVWRRTYETSNASTILYRRALARGQIASNWITFAQNGVALNQIIGSAATGVGVQLNKDAARANLITWSIWAIDSLGAFYNLNNANSRATASADTSIFWEGFSPGAVANLSTGQINQVAAGVSTNLVGTVAAPGALSLIARGIESGQLLIPKTIPIPPAAATDD